jgi:chemotaxis protein MotA
VEMGRRAIPGHVRPSFSDVEKACREKLAEAVAVGAA